MGQQQLLLIILGVIIVGIAVAVGITMFTGGARDANRDQVFNDLANIAARAQGYYRRPGAMGGGGNSFVNFKLSAVDTGNANGSYGIVTGTTTPTSISAAFIGNVTTADQANVVIIEGYGREPGDINATLHVAAVVTVSPTGYVTAKLN